MASSRKGKKVKTERETLDDSPSGGARPAAPNPAVAVALAAPSATGNSLMVDGAALRRHYARKLFEVQVRRANGAEFQRLFSEVMTRQYPEFVPMRPYGDRGDEGNDGYIPASGTYYQLYSPLYPGESLAEAARKALRDFKHLKQHWDTRRPLREYRFAFNDQWNGSNVVVEEVLAKIAKKYSLTTGPFLAKDLEAVALALPVDSLQDVIGLIPEPGLMADADYTAVRDVVEHLLRAAKPISASGVLVAPEFDAKIAFNGLGSEVGHLLHVAAMQADAVEDYFSLRSPGLRQELRDHLANLYARRKRAAARRKASPDALFFELLRAMTPAARRGARQVQDAVLVVMAYYFEACDVFESPP